MDSKKTVAIGFLGYNLDATSNSADRWMRWRPTVGLCGAEDFLVDRLELLIDARYKKLADEIAADIAQVSPETEVRQTPLKIRDPWDFQEVYEALHDFCTAYDFDPQSEQYLAHMTTGTHVSQICLYLLTEAHYLPGKLIQTAPARGSKSRSRRGAENAWLGTRQIIDLDLSKYDRLATRFSAEQAEARDFLRSGIATRNSAFNKLIDEVEVVALRSSAPILLTGPTGAGKSQLASRIYELRQQRSGLEGALVEINCATLRGDTATSTLFGHKKGAFTGAQANRPGLLREAHKGLLFLDEIGELGLDEQAMLLRALEDGTFIPVGSDTPAKSHFQLIAGTNRDLAAEASAGKFREDLLARINLWTFRLPALSERREDIAPNLDYELKRFAETEGRAATFNKEAQEVFLNFAEAPGSPWRGNFRDLNAAVTRMATLAPRGRIRSEDVKLEIERLNTSWQRPAKNSESNIDFENYFSPETLAEIDPFDRIQIAYVISICKESKTLSEAGRKAFSQSRKKKANPNDSDRLRKFLAKWHLDFAAL
ncbi:MAG: transcriptional regulatory protein RtcR [Verrucomicrobiales bacterium]|jgi:transcriptional regulatory protein RtcR